MSNPSKDTRRSTLFIAVQYLIPQHAISRIVGWAARLENRLVKNLLIRWFIKHFRVDLSEATSSRAEDYPSFNGFFTRALRPATRPLPVEPNVLISPVDGTVSQSGPIEADRILQAKGQDFLVGELLADERLAEPFHGGAFATLYLAPYNYHRIHMPLDGRLLHMLHVPGRLFSVNAASTQGIPKLFSRNERVVCLFDTSAGPMACVLVGALNVGSIETTWAGEVAPRRGRTVSRWGYDRDSLELARGAELGRFNMGSTVIVLFSPGRVALELGLRPGETIRMGQPIGRTLFPERDSFPATGIGN